MASASILQHPDAPPAAEYGLWTSGILARHGSSGTTRFPCGTRRAGDLVRFPYHED